MTTKPKITQDFFKLPQELKEQVKLVYPEGFSEHLIEFTNAKGELVSALRFETEEKVYLLRMSKRHALQIIEDDEDYDSDGILKIGIKKEYEDKHGDED